MVVVLVGGLLLGGCGFDEPVDPVPSSTPAVSATPEPSPTPDLTRRPERPAAMDEPTTDGAIAAATYVLELVAYTFASGDTGLWRSITASSCELCVGLASDVDGMVEVGDSSTGAAFTIEQAQAREIAEDRWFGVDMVVVQDSSERFDSGGAVVGSDPGGRYSAVFALSWDGGWRVEEMGFEEIPAETSAES
ncbi:DUF6318 family protein [Cellulomonas flavigena]|uniref:DUF6318 family protein n=1 Tax=Cellulomonas flavigena TaxID=1711 RepID=UPI00019E3E48|nr:DUF6318 family protein [Cellulomonas flavigena]